jgi:RNA polymerase sigma factor (sigma-70 family)
LKKNNFSTVTANDSLLWNSFKLGNHASFEMIYRTQFDFLAQYGKSLSKDDDTIADCIQELFIELWNRRETIGETDNIRSYLLVAFKRKLIKKLNNQDVEISEKHIINNTESFEINIIEEETISEQKELLQKGLQELTNKQKEIIHLKFFQELEYEEISKVMDISYQSCRNLLSGAIKKLENIFNRKIS